MLDDAACIDIYTQSHNLHPAQMFCDRLLSAGRNATCHESPERLVRTALATGASHAAVAISYSGLNQQLATLLPILAERGCPVVFIGTAAAQRLHPGLTAYLTVSDREHLQDRITQFASHIAVQYALDALYGCLFARDYERSIAFLERSLPYTRLPGSDDAEPGQAHPRPAGTEARERYGALNPAITSNLSRWRYAAPAEPRWMAAPPPGAPSAAALLGAPLPYADPSACCPHVSPVWFSCVTRRAPRCSIAQMGIGESMHLHRPRAGEPARERRLMAENASNRIVITVLGKNRPGIVAGISRVLGDENVDIRDITQSIIEDIFTMTMIADISAAASDFTTLQERLSEAGESIGVNVQIQREDVFNYMYRL